jgi:pimeloyl-ACP methyl ester carboxylesterase
MTTTVDYSALDQPQMSQSMFYPQQLWLPAPDGASDHFIPVGPGVSVSARFYRCDPDSPSILFFHGNGEVSCQYDPIAPYYTGVGANLFVADFRGYGQSDGSPSFSGMISDAGAVFQYFQQLLAAQEFTGPLFVMGRSLGCHSAVEVAARYQEEIKGLIMESGSAGIERMVKRRGLSSELPHTGEMLRLHREKLRSISLPLLAIHGERDDLVPVEAAVETIEAMSSDNITLEIIAGAGHNDLLWMGQRQYFDAVRKFILDQQ